MVSSGLEPWLALSLKRQSNSPSRSYSASAFSVGVGASAVSVADAGALADVVACAGGGAVAVGESALLLAAAAQAAATACTEARADCVAVGLDSLQLKICIISPSSGKRPSFIFENMRSSPISISKTPPTVLNKSTCRPNSRFMSAAMDRALGS